MICAERGAFVTLALFCTFTPQDNIKRIRESMSFIYPCGGGGEGELPKILCYTEIILKYVPKNCYIIYGSYINDIVPISVSYNSSTVLGRVRGVKQSKNCLHFKFPQFWFKLNPLKIAKKSL